MKLILLNLTCSNPLLFDARREIFWISVLGEKKFPELLQFQITPQSLAQEALKILKDRTIRERMKEDLREVSRRIGHPGASRRAAAEILQILQNG